MTYARWLQQAPLLGFFVLSFSWSWACWALSPAIKPHLPWLATLLMFAGSFGPSFAAITVVASTRRSVGLSAWLERCLQWRFGWGWWAVSLLVPLALESMAAGLHIALGGTIGITSASEHPLMTIANLFLILLLGGPMGEEFGWRGYALPILQTRFGWRVASLGLGLVWGLWHLPLFFIDGTAQNGTPLGLFLLSVLAMSVVLAWLVNHTSGSVAAALAFHTAINFWPSLVPVLPTEASHRAYALGVAMMVVLALVALQVCGPTAARGSLIASAGFDEGTK